MKSKLSFVSMLIYLCLIPLCMHAQNSNYSDKDYKKNPYWINMMDDPNANYFETVKAYNLYFEAHALPKDEDAILGMRSANEQEKKNKHEWLKHLFSNRKEVSEQELAFAIKKFKFWQINVEPWVQDDGSILSTEKRLEILKTIRKP